MSTSYNSENEFEIAGKLGIVNGALTIAADNISKFVNYTTNAVKAFFNNIVTESTNNSFATDSRREINKPSNIPK